MRVACNRMVTPDSLAHMQSTSLFDLRASAASRLSPAVWTYWCEAAAVVLDRFHTSPTYLTASHPDREYIGVLTWLPTDEVMRASHGNEPDATRDGAYAIAGVVLNGVDGWTLIGRTAHASGADIFIEHRQHGIFKLEVSGMAEGIDPAALSELRSRLSRKPITPIVSAANPSWSATTRFRYSRCRRARQATDCASTSGLVNNR